VSTAVISVQSPPFLLPFLSPFHGRPLTFHRGVVPIFLVFTSALEIYGIQKSIFEAVIERSSDGRITRFARCKLWFLPQVSRTLVQMLIAIITFLCMRLCEFFAIRL
jgi:hypothetical protein